MQKEILGMSTMNKIIRCALAALLGISLAQSAELPQAGSAKHQGVATCAASQCHGSAIPREATGVLQNEYVTWTQADPHSRAYEVLSNEESRRIAARLGIGNAREASECLDCHADNVAPTRRGEKFQIADGVGCEACHGGAEHWLASHYNVAGVSRADNLAAGMYPTNEAEARADLCLSCHLGTANKFASHRMMAAGHPRLAFELDTFTELWRTLGRQPHFRNDAEYRQRKDVPSHSYTWATGLVADARLRLDLIASSHFDGIGMFPELALYDCHACHRSMKSVQWRRLPRHGSGGPGMPFINDGTFVMSLALASALQPELVDELQTALQRLHAAGSESVTSIRTAAAALDTVLARLDRALTPAALRGRESQLLQAVLATGAAGNYSDYASAEQAFMAVQMLVLEIDDPALETKLDALANSLDDDERYRPSQFVVLLNSLREN
jgi:Cytochrome c554 and c-prime